MSSDTAETEPRASRAVYIHGVGNKVAHNELKNLWDEYIFERKMGKLTSMAYWADIRYPAPLPSPGAQRLLEEHRVTEPQIGAWSDEALIEEARSIAREFEPGADEFLEGLARSLLNSAADVEREQTQLSVEQIGPEVLPWPIRGPAFRWFVRTFLKDAGAYFFSPQGEEMRARLHRALDGGTGPVALVGHSLGSIISYEVLHEAAGSGTDVALFVTIGSQLGVKEVQDQISRPLEVLPSVRVWRNFLDRWDIGSFRQLLSNEFSPIGRIKDAWVDNPASGSHAESGYLTLPLVRRTILRVFEGS
jgi:hypothetical protein